VSQIEINGRSRMQKLQSMFIIKEKAKTANETIAEILKDKVWKLTVINHLTYAAATVQQKMLMELDAKIQKLTIQKYPHGLEDTG
jgi:hypothetical protein